MLTTVHHWIMVPRLVAFVDGIAVAAGLNCNNHSGASLSVVHLPTDHYDFIGPVDVVGKTLLQIELEAEHVRQQMTQAG